MGVGFGCEFNKGETIALTSIGHANQKAEIDPHPPTTTMHDTNAPCVSKAQKWLPERPNPVCTSSATQSPPAPRMSG